MGFKVANTVQGLMSLCKDPWRAYEQIKYLGRVYIFSHEIQTGRVALAFSGLRVVAQLRLHDEQGQSVHCHQQ